MLCACDLLNEGWDSPITEVLFMARPTMSKVIYTQQLGRGMRTHKGKEFLMVFDFVDNANMFNCPYSLHRLLNITEYVPGGMVLGTKSDIKWDKNMFKKGEKPSVLVDFPISVMDYEIIDIFNWQDKANSMYSEMELVRHVTEYESYKDHGTYKQRFVGYRFRHLLKVEFDSDNERLGKILYALGNCELKPEFRISYTVKDPEAAKNELLGKAVKDAKEKAVVITAAAGVILKDIQSIDYSWGEIEFEVSPMNRLMKACAPVPSACEDACYDLDIEPDDIEVADTVTVVWEIA